MIDKIKQLNNRQEYMLENMERESEYALSDIAPFFIDKKGYPSLATLRRDIKGLCTLGFLTSKGKLKSTKYQLTIFGMINTPIDAHKYCGVETDKRKSNTHYNFSLFTEFPNELFSKKEIEDLDMATKLFIEKSQGTSEVIRQKEMERFVIELSWKSSKIEGNTYTLLDTELLLQKGIEAPGHTKNEAVMILNHKKAFQYILDYKEKFQKINVKLIEDVHRLLVSGLDVSFGLRSKPVGVTGSKYIPLSTPTQINEALNDLCLAIDRINNPQGKALLTLVGISYTQPFEDGNKRTARLVTNAILLAHASAPLSYRNVDEINYRESILVFYEKNILAPMRDIFVNQYIFACENYLKF